jgi:branched-chain amino acid transport system ATP-binding protein
MKLLEINDVGKEYGGLTALRDISFAISSERIVGIIGPNGAGKTTLFNCLSGLEPVTKGKIIYKGQDITDLNPHQIVKLGLVRTFQTTRVFESLPVLENVMVGRHLHSKSNFLCDLFRLRQARRDHQASAKSALQFLRLVKLHDFADVRAGQLTLAQARRMELARVLATEPELLLLDEPGAGLDAQEREDLAELLIEIYSRGINLMIIEHDIGFVMDLCTEVMVLNFGTLIARGKPEEVQANKEVLEAYLGDADDL